MPVSHLQLYFISFFFFNLRPATPAVAVYQQGWCHPSREAEAVAADSLMQCSLAVLHQLYACVAPGLFQALALFKAPSKADLSLFARSVFDTSKVAPPEQPPAAKPRATISHRIRIALKEYLNTLL